MSLSYHDAMAASDGTIEVTVVVPAKDEKDNLPILLDEIRDALEGRQFEVIVVDDGSSDGTGEVLKTYAAEHPWLRPYRHELACGQSCAVRTGVQNARGEVVATIDGDGENNPAYIPKLLEALEAGGPSVALAAGQRLGRKASLAKRYASKLANKVRGAILKDNTRDSGCGLKALRRDVFLQLPYFDSWHRFLPALVIREGFGVVHIDVQDRQRRHGQSKYGIFDRALIGVLDLFGVWWLRRRRKKIPAVSALLENADQAA
ncbi:glycosyltransferase involved in cell wall biosynthesis [Roseibium hamelinense]|uniref:Glycosyltransferase involved in cell wall biosynthesis n=1 Tax=Roseibium hamelinense TaxID=150831 RepID=A0A562TJ70_9HYPH|nr:glycosyltransferase family 2 protein [Roseibium hamelinense]MTI46077.1 glycosyltransferase family 2 protein [Roseibium hamelinense]TWI92730.1 glycosyltransferase involved in cell wall biosynthesis [Roseibium hamelinense]